MKEQNSTQKVNKPENQWIVLSQICIVWQGTAILAHHIVVGLQNRKILGKLQLDPNLTLEKTTNLVRQRETVKQQQNILVRRFNSTPVHVDGIAKGKSRRRRGNFKEKSQDKSKD